MFNTRFGFPVEFTGQFFNPSIHKSQHDSFRFLLDFVLWVGLLGRLGGLGQAGGASRVSLLSLGRNGMIALQNAACRDVGSITDEYWKVRLARNNQ